MEGLRSHFLRATGGSISERRRNRPGEFMGQHCQSDGHFHLRFMLYEALEQLDKSSAASQAGRADKL